MEYTDYRQVVIDWLNFFIEGKYVETLHNAIIEEEGKGPWLSDISFAILCGLKHKGLLDDLTSVFDGIFWKLQITKLTKHGKSIPLPDFQKKLVKVMNKVFGILDLSFDENNEEPRCDLKYVMDSMMTSFNALGLPIRIYRKVLYGPVNSCYEYSVEKIH
jgi:hypothetical protein